MSCAKFETDIALYAGGDLPAARIARMELHLAECGECRTLAEELRAGQALLGELRDDPLEAAMLAQIHRRVLAEVGSAGVSRRLAWAPLLALAAAVVLAVVLFWPRHQTKPSPVARMAPSSVAPAPRPIIIPARHRVLRHRRRPPAPVPGPPILVQFVTDDPNIVVYWLIDQKPQGD